MMNLSQKLFLLMVILSFGFLIKPIVNADWWDRSIEDRPVYPRQQVSIPTQAPEPTNPPQVQPTATPRVGEPQATEIPVPTSTASTSDEDPCASGKSYTGEYCGWSPRVGSDEGGGGNGGEAPPASADIPVKGLSYTSGEEISLSDIMLLFGILCLLLYAKSKFAPNLEKGFIGKRRYR